MTKGKNAINFTKAALNALPLPEGKKRAWYWDTKVNSLALMVTGTGRRSFYHYRWVAGKPVQRLIGAFPDLSIEQARQKAESLNGLVARGEDPRMAAGTARGEWTLADLGEWYVEEHSKKRKRSWRQDAMYFENHFKVFAKTKLSHITKADLRSFHEDMGDKVGPYAANKALRLLSAVFNRAITYDKFRGENPAAAIEFFPERSRDRRLMPDEMPLFIRAVQDESNTDVRDFVLLSLYTGARKANVLAMAWQQIDFTSRTWRIPMTKTGDWQVIPLEDAEIGILRRRKQGNATPWVFPGPGATGHMQDPRKGWLRILRRAGLDDLHLHDLRRTLGSWMVDSGASLPVIGKVLNHQNQSTTAIYARLSLDPLRVAKQKTHGAILQAAKTQDMGAS
jgi:integrase